MISDEDQDPLAEEIQDCKDLIPSHKIKTEEIASCSSHNTRKSKLAKNSIKISKNDYGDSNNSDASKNRIKLFVNYFEIISEFHSKTAKRRHIEVRCKLCKKGTTLRGTYGVSSNFLKHLKRMHFDEYVRYRKDREEVVKEYKNKNKSQQVKLKNIEKIEISVTPYNDDDDDDAKNEKDHDHNNVSEQPIVKNEESNTKPKRITSKKKHKIYPLKTKDFGSKIIKFIISTMSPLEIVENKTFKALFEGTNLTVMNKVATEKKLDNLYRSLVKIIKLKLMDFNYCCTTVNLWCYKKYNFFGVTCHWLDENFKRNSVLLCCKRFPDNFNNLYDKISKTLKEIHEKYEINLKVTASITDIGTNFADALEESGISKSYIDYGIINDENLRYNVDSLSQEIQHEYITNIEHIVPQHIRSPYHVLSLIATIDFNNYLKSDYNLIERNKQVFAKCSQLWAKVKNTKVKDSSIDKILGSPLTYPCATEWNTVYDALNKIIINKDKLYDLCVNLNLPVFNEDDLNYLNEYCIIMKPLADGLDFIQQENNSYYGYLIPTLATIMTKYRKLEFFAKMKYLENGIKCIKDSLLKRFYDIFTLQKSINDAIIASIVCPAVKIRWLNVMKETAPNFEIKIIDDQIISLMEDANNEIEFNKEKITNQQDSRLNRSFFDFDDVTDYSYTTHGVGIDYYNYLNDTRTDNQVLNEYPAIKKLFLKYNSPLLSYTCISKVFSYAKIINDVQSTDDSDEIFEKYIFLKLNSN